jgi:hypothetical protein
MNSGGRSCLGFYRYAEAFQKLNNAEAFPKLPVLEKQPWIYGKKRALDRFFKSISQNLPGFWETLRYY